ncbi:MAG TPA: amino acid ABC transporter permease [Gaiellaceae bacterium]|nr:amino acid ABC transporter permease [Gaiellaceae bacterium]
MATRVDTLEPVPAPERPPERRLPPRDWARENLFGTWFDTVLTVVFALVVAWLLYRVGKFALVDARWEIIERNITNLMVSGFPREELWRVWAALLVLAASLGFGAGALAATRRREVEEGRGAPPQRASALRRAGPILLLVAVLLWFAQSLQATLLTVAVGLLGIGAYLLGRRVSLRATRAALVVLAGIALAFAVVVAFGGVGWHDWGGFMLTVFLAVGGILLSFPFGVLLALGRRSSLPAVRVVCVAYIELFRGVPLIAVLFMSAFMIGFLLPPGVDRPSLVVRALIGLVLFTSAYVAEIVRGGLQGVPAGQVEAAQALGLSPLRITTRIVLPQALRSVIPGLVGQFISLYKDTSLVAIIGLTELLSVSQNITKQPDFLAQGLIVETLLFAAFVYWAGAYWMSRESQRLERRLGLGER